MSARSSGFLRGFVCGFGGGTVVARRTVVLGLTLLVGGLTVLTGGLTVLTGGLTVLTGGFAVLTGGRCAHGGLMLSG